MADIHDRACPLREAMCGLELHIDHERVSLIRADRDDVWRNAAVNGVPVEVVPA